MDDLNRKVRSRLLFFLKKDFKGSFFFLFSTALAIEKLEEDSEIRFLCERRMGFGEVGERKTGIFLTSRISKY